MVNKWKTIAYKLRRIILLHFGLVTFRFAYWRTQTLHFHDFWISGRVPDSQNQYDLSLETPGYLNNQRKSQILFKATCWKISKCWKYKNWEMLETTGTEKS